MPYTNIQTGGTTFKKLRIFQNLGVPAGNALPSVETEDGFPLFILTDGSLINGKLKYWDGANWTDIESNDLYAEASDTGTPNDFVCSFSPAQSSYVEGKVFKIKFLSTNSGSVTLTPDALPTRDLVMAGDIPLSGGEINANSVYFVVVKSTNLQIISGSVWGSIVGTLSDQVDLKDALDLKLNVSDYNNKFKGKYPTLAALESAFPTANEGDYAQVDDGSTLTNYTYDTTSGWVEGAAGSSATDTDGLPEGTTNLYFTNTRARAAFSGASPRIKITAGVIDIDTLSTDDLSEGAKKFYSDALSRLALSATPGGALSYNNTTGVFTVTLPDGLNLSGASPILYDPSTGIISLGLDELDSRYQLETDSLGFSTGLEKNGKDVTALTDNALWNANKLQGFPITSEEPQDGDLLVYESSLDTWILSNDWVPSMPEYANNTAAVSAGLAVGKMYKLPYDATNDWQLTAIVH